MFKKGDSHDLSEVLSTLVSDPDEMSRLKDSGLDWVKEHRDWNKLASYLNEVHNAIFAGGKPELLGSGQALTILNGKVSTVIQGKPNLMVIMDEFSTTALSADANLVRPTPENWQALLDEHRIDMLVVSPHGKETTALGIKVGWYGEEEIADLKQLVEACRDRNIPTVFYNKEDPVHFNRFSKTSALFDHVFTTDEGASQYKPWSILPYNPLIGFNLQPSPTYIIPMMPSSRTEVISPSPAPTTQENIPSGVKRWTCSSMRQRITGWSFMTASLTVGIRNMCFQNDFHLTCEINSSTMRCSKAQRASIFLQRQLS